MKSVLLDGGRPVTCEPITCTRPLGECRVGNRGLREAQLEGLALAQRSAGESAGRTMTLYLRGDAWVSGPLLQRLAASDRDAVLRDGDGQELAWLGGTAGGPVRDADMLAADQETFLIRYPWDLLRINELLLGQIGASRIEGDVSPHSHSEGVLVVGRGSRILPGVFSEGTVVIGERCKIGPNCYLRGSTSIGDNCHIGQSVEIKNSIVMNGTSIGHLSYCGDSVIGEGVNFGAGTITANFRHDGRAQRAMAGGRLVDTGRRKFGAVVGDRVHTGIHTSIYPGRKLWPDTMTRPGDVVQRDTMPLAGAGG